MPWEAENLAGKRFGKLTAVSRTVSGAGRKSRWVCQCDCGNEKVASASNLKSGFATHCGCSRVGIKHGASETKLYKRWKAMKRRCTAEAADQFQNYGGRGIQVCPEWAADFSVFQHWALANGYRDDLELDRIDNDGPYSPENCRYVSRMTNANNLRLNRRFEFEGRSRTLAEISRMTGMRYGTLRKRLVEDGMGVAEALNLPVDRYATRRQRHGY